jgi:hypothetical protein
MDTPMAILRAGTRDRRGGMCPPSSLIEQAS